MKAPLKPLKRDRRRAVALIMVVTSIALMTVLILAIFSVTETEFKSSGSFVASRSAKQLGDMSTAIVQAQIQNGQNTFTTPSQRTIHATQPGMVRVYTAGGAFTAAYKLYSSSAMKVTGSSENLLLAAAQLVPNNWNTQPARYVDLNEPVIRPALAGGGAPPAVYFPIIDPRAAYNFNGTQTPAPNQPTTQVEGFSYTADVSGVTLPTAGAPTDLRLPMPVEWLYVLQDGTLGTVGAGNNFVAAPGGGAPSATNPIVGRIAFWTDDESCKVNVNTASEPTFMASPYFFHDRDRRWAHFPPTTGEFQRYPGHPATTALSAVLAPNLRLDPELPAPGLTRNQIVAIKESIYDLSPKINGGGSMAGTRPYTLDDFSGVNGETQEAQSVVLTASNRERLFASVDEMLFRDGAFNATNGRQEAKFTLPDGRNLFDHDTLERSRFFLTAQSRSPEFSSYGLPRVCMWPIASETQIPGGLPPDQLATSFDNAIALCSTLRGTAAGASVANSYIFRRSQNLDATYDVTGTKAGLPVSQGLARNNLLIRYLDTQMSQLVWPRSSALGASTNFTDKYGADNVSQMAVQFFDYIRCVNLYDGVLARNNDGLSLSSAGVRAKMLNESDADYNVVRRYFMRDNGKFLSRTYTNQRLSPRATQMSVETTSTAGRSRANSQGVLPGHGQVTPALWQKTTDKVYRGFGRMFTLSEVGFQFICTADGKPDPYAINFNGTLSGGGSALRINPRADARINPGQVEARMRDAYPRLAAITTPPGYPNYPARWFSNFPPLNRIARGQLPPIYGATSTPGPTHVSNHPGYDAANWNYTLAEDTPLSDGVTPPPGGGPVRPAEKRIQAIFLMETFCPSLGWTKFYPEYSIVFDGAYLSGLRIEQDGEPPKPLFDTTGEIIVKSDRNLYEASDVHSVGGHAGPTAIAGGRGGRPISNYAAPTGVVALGSDPSPYWVSNNTDARNALKNYGLTSNFITVNRNKPMRFRFPTSGQSDPLARPGEFVIKIYDKHIDRTTPNLQPIQIIRLNFAQSIAGSADMMEMPVPHLPGAPADNEPAVQIKFQGQNVAGLLSPPDRGARAGNQEDRAAVNPTVERARLGNPVGPGAQNYRSSIDGQGRISYVRAYPGPHYWCYNFLGCIGRAIGTPNPQWSGSGSMYSTFPRLLTTNEVFNPNDGFVPVSPELHQLRGRLDTGSSGRTSPPGGGVGFNPPGGSGNGVSMTDGYSDTTRTFVPAVGDYRMIAARYDVPASLWMPHPNWNQATKLVRSIHSFTGFWGTSEGGARLSYRDNDARPDSGPNPTQPFNPQIDSQLGLAAGIKYSQATRTDPTPTINRIPDLPGKASWARAANSYGDFDNGISNSRDGPYINKPDEGNFFAERIERWVTGSEQKFYRSGYFFESYDNSEDWRTGIYMTPNRMVTSPVMFGSLPTGVWGGPQVVGTTANVSAIANVSEFSTMECRPWQTLLFRPHMLTTAGQNGTKANHPGDYNPKDHYLLDMFFMPVVEPYAISEPLSVAGRVNLNYQIMPFTYIRRATAIHALLKGEYMTAIPNEHSVNAKETKGGTNTPGQWDTYFNDQTDQRFWHRPIDVARTVRQFDEKFANDGNVNVVNRGLFRTASQICEVYLIPEDKTGPFIRNVTPPNPNAANRKAAMDNFWDDHSTTGDNVRERPYSNLYSRVTTRSNTFRVHVRAQAIKKARSVDPGTFDPARDTVLSEYRGSTLIERYIDPTDTSVALQDYGASQTPLTLPPLDTYYQFRTLETKRFNP